jgi:predicted dehydrogenase
VEFAPTISTDGARPEGARVNILLVGLGGFGRNHLRAWTELGMGEHLRVAELNPALLAECDKYNVAAARRTQDYRTFLADADVVDIVTSTDSHFELCRTALEAGKDVFVEKPMTATAAQSRELDALVRRTGRILQVGYYYRFHPISTWAKECVQSGRLGAIRYLAGRFMGFKRPRTDVGVTHTDAIHFIDLFNWLLESAPAEVFAVTRDHFGRSMEDLSITILTYPNGTLAKIESGYIQPGRWKDKVVPNAWTNKDIFICGDQATIEVDFEVEHAVLHQVRHEKVDGLWRVQSQGATTPNLPAAGPLEQIKAELTAFLESVKTRARPSANVADSGVTLAELMETLYESARRGQPVSLKARGS